MSMTTYDDIPKRFLSWVAKEWGDDVDTLDVEAIYDRTLSDEENRTIFKARFPMLKLIAQRPDDAAIEQLEASHAATWTPGDEAPLKPMLENVASIAIVGDRGSGKTALAHRVCDALKETGLPVYVFKHPDRAKMYAAGYGVLHRFGDLEDLQDCVLWISEPQLHIPVHDKKANDGLLRLLSLCRQRNVVLVIDTCDSRFITRGLESYIDVWMVKDCDPQLLKQGSKIKKIIQENCLITVDGFGLPQAQFLYNARKHPELGGRHRFALPHYWTDAHSTPYRLAR